MTAATQHAATNPFRVLNWLRSSLWFLPVLCVLGGVALSFGSIALDGRFEQLAPSFYAIGHETALSILSTVAASMVSLTALVLTLTMVVVQLAMGQFSPRIVRTFLRDRPNQYAIGTFVAAFAHSMIAMSFVSASTDDKAASVPGLAILVAFVLVIVSIMVLVHYVDHIGRSLRVAALIDSVSDELAEAVARQFPAKPVVRADVAGASPIITADTAGVVFHVDHDRLVDEASRASCKLELVPALGDFVPYDAPLVRVHGRFPRIDKVRAAVSLGSERTMHQDTSYGFRLLVDIAVRSLSDLGDATTAVHALDRIHAGLRDLMHRPFPDGTFRDSAGETRLVIPTVSWPAFVALAFEEIRILGKGSPQIARRLRAALEDLRAMAPPDRVAPLDRQLELLEDAVKESFSGPEQAEASKPDVKGIGSSGD
ncbi:MAG: DUF2254 domain-containing protein [Kofleriaceae bacterium]